MSTREERQRAIDAAVASVMPSIPKNLVPSSQGSGLRGIEPPRFRTITGEDWRRSIAEARQTVNAVRGQIQSAVAKALADGALRPKILALKLGKSKSGNVGKTSKDL